MFARLRNSAMTLLALGLTACGGGSPTAPPTPTPVPTASITVGAPTAALTAGSTASVAVTLTRGGGFTGAVTVTATGLPTGVTASTETIASGSTTATITLTAAVTASAASAAAVSVTATASGVTIAPAAVALTVTPANGAVIALSAAAGSIENGRSTPITVTVTRVGTFTGPVTVTIPSASLPAGVSVASQTVAAGATTATLTIASNLSAPVGTTSLNVTASASGATIPSQPYALTITAGPIVPIGADLASADGSWGSRMALSSDGTRMVVTASGTTNGTTRVYERGASGWTQLGADILGEVAGGAAGAAVAINAAGTRIAVGAYLNTGAGTAAGSVRVYDLVGGTWTQVGADLDGDAAGWGFGAQVALSASGSRLGVAAAGVGTTTGRVKIFDLVSGTWTQVGNTLTGSDEFATGFDLSDDGSTIAVGVPSAAGVSRIGTAVVYRLVANTWTPVGSTLVGEQGGDNFGTWVSLNADGSRVAVGAPSDNEGGVSGGGGAAGKVRVFGLSGGAWTQLGNDVLGKAGLNGEGLGESVVLSSDGTRLAVTGPSQSVSRVFTLTNGAWTQNGPDILAYGTASRSEGLALSGDGRTVGVGYVNGVSKIARTFRITP